MNKEYQRTNEKKTLIVVILTVLTMIAEIIYGYITNSMALLADGYHMGTHALSLILTYVAYILIRKLKDSDLFPNGTSKIGTLTAYTSSLFLGFTGLWIIIEATQRFFNPLQIQFNDAIFVAVIGLVVNGVCILIMQGKHIHLPHEHHHENCAEHHNEGYSKNDYNFKAAYLHILTDLLTSVLAIAALVIGKYWNSLFLDALIGFLGGVIILKWTVGLLKNTVSELIDLKTKK